MEKTMPFKELQWFRKVTLNCYCYFFAKPPGQTSQNNSKEHFKNNQDIRAWFIINRSLAFQVFHALLLAKFPVKFSNFLFKLSSQRRFPRGNTCDSERHKANSGKNPMVWPPHFGHYPVLSFRVAWQIKVQRK